MKNFLIAFFLLVLSVFSFSGETYHLVEFETRRDLFIGFNDNTLHFGRLNRLVKIPGHDPSLGVLTRIEVVPYLESNGHILSESFGPPRQAIFGPDYNPISVSMKLKHYFSNEDFLYFKYNEIGERWITLPFDGRLDWHGNSAVRKNISREQRGQIYSFTDNLNIFTRETVYFNLDTDYKAGYYFAPENWTWLAHTPKIKLEIKYIWE